MRYKLTADVEGNIFINEKVSTENNNTTYEFITDANGKLAQISVSKPVPNNKLNNFKQSFKKGTGNIKVSISIGGDKELHDELLKELQMVESNLAFVTQGALKRIRWDNPQLEYIPETDLDKENISVNSFSANKKYDDQKVRITSNSLIGLVLLSSKYESLLLAKAIWKEGMIYYRNFQYIQSFYQFYFVIEDFYISGKSSSKKSVLRKFQESKELQYIATSTLEKIQKTSMHNIKLKNHLEEYNCEPTAIGLLEMLYEARNNLHHFHSKSTRIQGTPFNQSHFNTLALTTMYIVTSAIGIREAKISQSLKTK